MLYQLSVGRSRSKSWRISFTARIGRVCNVPVQSDRWSLFTGSGERHPAKYPTQCTHILWLCNGKYLMYMKARFVKFVYFMPEIWFSYRRVVLNAGILINLATRCQIIVLVKCPAVYWPLLNAYFLLYSDKRCQRSSERRSYGVIFSSWNYKVPVSPVWHREFHS